MCNACTPESTKKTTRRFAVAAFACKCDTSKQLRVLPPWRMPSAKSPHLATTPISPVKRTGYLQSLSPQTLSLTVVKAPCTAERISSFGLLIALRPG